MAAHSPARPGAADRAPPARGGAGRDELAVLPGAGPAPAGHGRCGGIPRPGAAGRVRGPQQAQRPRPGPHHDRRGRDHRCPPGRPAAGVPLCLRQLRPVHVLRDPGAPDRRAPGRQCRPYTGHGAGRDRSAGGLDAHRRRGGDPGRAGRRPAGLRPSRTAAGGGGGRRVLVGHPLRHRSAGHGPAAPRQLRAHAGPAPDVRHRHRRAHPSPVPDPPGPARHRAGDHRCRGAPGARAHDQRGEHSCVISGWARQA